MDFSHRISKPSRLFQGGVPQPRILPPHHPRGLLKVGIFGLLATWGEGRNQNQGDGVSACAPPWSWGRWPPLTNGPLFPPQAQRPLLPCSLRQGRPPPAYPRPRCPGCSPPIPPRGLSRLLPARAPTPQLLPQVTLLGPLGGLALPRPLRPCGPLSGVYILTSLAWQALQGARPSAHCCTRRPRSPGSKEGLRCVRAAEGLRG